MMSFGCQGYCILPQELPFFSMCEIAEWHLFIFPQGQFTHINVIPKLARIIELCPKAEFTISRSDRQQHHNHQHQAASSNQRSAKQQAASSKENQFSVLHYFCIISALSFGHTVWRYKVCIHIHRPPLWNLPGPRATIHTDSTDPMLKLTCTWGRGGPDHRPHPQTPIMKLTRT